MDIMCGNPNKVKLKFLKELSVKEKALLMAAVMQLEVQYFNSNGFTTTRLCGSSTQVDTE